jgi:hypothetical protein
MTATATAELKQVDESEKIKLLSMAASHSATTVIWLKNEKFTGNTRIREFNQIQKRLLLPRFEENHEVFQAQIAADPEALCYFCVSDEEFNLFFTSQFRKEESSLLFFDIPKLLYKTQRRSNQRYKIPTGKVLKISFQDPLFPDVLLHRKVLDISVGGLSFLTTEADGAMFAEGIVIENLQFILKTKQFKIRAEVRYFSDTVNGAPRAGTKVGMKFLDLKPTDIETIQKFIDEELKKYYVSVLR